MGEVDDTIACSAKKRGAIQPALAIPEQAPDESRLNPVIWRRHRVKEGHLLPRDAADQDVERLFGVIDQARDAALSSGLSLWAPNVPRSSW